MLEAGTGEEWMNLIAYLPAGGGPNKSELPPQEGSQRYGIRIGNVVDAVERRTCDGCGSTEHFSQEVLWDERIGSERRLPSEDEDDPPRATEAEN
jgi:hypothetical protein